MKVLKVLLTILIISTPFYSATGRVDLNGHLVTPISGNNLSQNDLEMLYLDIHDEMVNKPYKKYAGYALCSDIIARQKEEYESFKKVALKDYEQILNFIENKYTDIADPVRVDSLILPGTETMERNYAYSESDNSLSPLGKANYKRGGGCFEETTKIMRLEYLNPETGKLERVDHHRPLSSIIDTENLVIKERKISSIRETDVIVSSTLEILKDHPGYQMNCISDVEQAWEGILSYEKGENFIEVEYESNGEKHSFKATPEHKVYAKIQENWDWVEVGNLQVGALLYSGKKDGIKPDDANRGRVLEITGIKPAEIPTEMVDEPVYSKKDSKEITGYKKVERQKKSVKKYTITTKDTMIFTVGPTEDTNIVVHNKIVVST